MSAERVEEIIALVAASQRRMSPERAYALLRACQELLAVVPRQGRLFG